MFNLSTQDVVLSIENTPLVNLDGLFYQEYHNFFGNKILLPNFQNKKFTTLEFQEHLPRMKLDSNDILMKQIKIFFMNTNITKCLSKKFKTDLKFKSVDLWIDNKDYHRGPHTDDKRIKLALQIYLSNNSVGTTLYTAKGNILKTFEFKFNSGYALYNNEFSLHGLHEPVIENGRTSVYVRYS